jgi:hypothetical protein
MQMLSVVTAFVLRLTRSQRRGKDSKNRLSKNGWRKMENRTATRMLAHLG